MTLDEAIKHAEEKAEELRAKAEGHLLLGEYSVEDEYSARLDCEECAKEHEQLAEWLRELKEAREKLAEWDKLELLYACYGIVVYKVKENDNG